MSKRLKAQLIGKALPLAALVVITASIAVAGDWLHHASRVRKYCHLPDYDYRPVGAGPTNPVSAVTSGMILTSLDADISGTPYSAAQAHTFQLSQSELRIDHCSLTLVTLTILDDGHWIAQFRAHQNPASVDSQDRPQFERFLRNRFHVVFRGVVGLETNQSAQTAVLAPPEFFKLEPTPFWVERGATEIIRLTGRSPDVKQFFNQVSRVDVDFRYE